MSNPSSRLPLGLLLVAAFAASAGSCMPSGGPCMDYCDYVCECHAGDEGFDCDACATVYEEADAETQDACQTELTTLQNDDQANGTGCDAPEDTAAG